MGQIDVSICMVTYNHKPYVEQAINSYLCQETDYTFEILIGDDVSPDGTAQYIREKYGDKVRLIERTENVGLNRNMYELYQQARGRYIYGCAGDDWAHDNHLIQKLAQFLDENPDYSGVSNWLRVVNENGEEIREDTCSNTVYTFRDWLLGTENRGCGSGMFRNYFATVGDEGSYIYKVCRNNEEIPIWSFMLERGKHYILPEKLLSYRYIRREGGTNYNSTHKLIDIFIDYKNAIDNMRKYHGAYCYDAMELKTAHDFIGPILRSLDVKQGIRFIKVLGFGKFCQLLWVAPCIKLTGMVPKRIQKKCIESAKEYIDK